MATLDEIKASTDPRVQLAMATLSEAIGTLAAMGIQVHVALGADPGYVPQEWPKYMYRFGEKDGFIVESADKVPPDAYDSPEAARAAEVAKTEAQLKGSGQ